MPNMESDIEPRRYSGKKHGLGHEQDGEDDEATTAWYILAVRFGPDLRNVLLERRRSTRNDDWLQRESGILALGALAEGEYGRCGSDGLY